MFDFNKDIARIEGWLTKKESEYLYELTKSLPNNSAVIEIGSWKGRSTSCLALGAKDNKNKVTIYAIDPHTGSSEQRKRFGKVNTYHEFINNIKSLGVEKWVIPLKEKSEEAIFHVPELIDVVFIDGAHEYKSVKQDYLLWFPRLRVGGTIAFHDCWHSIGVHWLTAALLLTSSKVRYPKLIDTLTVIEKTDKNTTGERFVNVLFVIYRLFIGWVGTVKINYFGGTVIGEK